MKGLVKPKEDDNDNDEDDTELDKRDQQLNAEKQFASMGINNKTGGSSSDPMILDQAAINAIRAKRERLRKSRAVAPDFISLDGGSNHGAAEGLSDDEPEFRGRIALLGSKSDILKKGVFDNVEEIEMGVDSTPSVKFQMEDDEDEEDKIWQEEQYRKALGKRIDDSSSTMSAPANAQTPHQQSYTYQGTAYQLTPNPPIGPLIAGVSRSAEVLSISQQSDVACRAMEDTIRRLQESHGRTTSSINMVEENLSASLSNITALEKSLSAAGEKFIFMQKLRDFVSVICDFLQDKAPLLEELEERMQKVHEDRASAIVERRAADSADEMMEVDAAVSAAMSILNKGGSSAAMVAAAASAAQAASAAMNDESNLPVEIDEFGRDKNKQKRMDAMRRADARKLRKAKADSRRGSSFGVDDAIQHVEGESSTDESDSESTSYQSNRESLLEIAEQIFSDASEEYSQLSVVKERFERWKQIYSSSYQDAYMSLSAPAIFSPYVRLELLKWDPLYEETDFNDMQWHTLLFDYGLPENGSDFNPGDADANLVPGLVEKIAIPILHHQIAHCWDMLSTRETKNAVSATNLVINYVPASSEALRELLAVIRTRLSDAIDSLTVPTWTPLIIKAVPNAARVAAYRFGMSIRLLRNICLWKDILALPILEKLALDELLAGKVLPHVRSVIANIHDAVTRTERIVVSLNGVWAGPGVMGERSQKLQALVEYVLTLGKALEKKHASGVSESETSGLARRLKKMLVELNEYDRARTLARNFQLKEAL